MKFWVGTDAVVWLSRHDLPFFVSANRLRKVRKLPRPLAPWALDSGGFSTIKDNGRYLTTAKEYAEEVREWRERIGKMEWAAVQDWMCEPVMLERTGKTVHEHQELTVASWLNLTSLAPDLPWVPVLQGWTLTDYHRCADLYESAGTDLASLPLVGVGSVCRRQGTKEAGEIVRSLYGRGLHNLHGFGIKTLGLSRGPKLAAYLASADSMAWSFWGRQEWTKRRQRMCGTEHDGGCSHCPAWCRRWYETIRRRVDRVMVSGTQTLLY